MNDCITTWDQGACLKIYVQSLLISGISLTQKKIPFFVRNDLGHFNFILQNNLWNILEFHFGVRKHFWIGAKKIFMYLILRLTKYFWLKASNHFSLVNVYLSFKILWDVCLSSHLLPCVINDHPGTLSKKGCEKKTFERIGFGQFVGINYFLF